MKNYHPVPCSYYDQLEAWATQKEWVEIVYRAEYSEPIKSTRSIIETIFSKDKVEYLRLQNQLTIRLDHLIAVNGIRPSSGDSCKA